MIAEEVNHNLIMNGREGGQLIGIWLEGKKVIGLGGGGTAKKSIMGV